MVNSTRDPGGDGDNDLTRQLQDTADLEAVKPPMSPDDATGAPEPGTDARAVWRAVAVCIDKGLPFPDWVRPYLRRTARRVEQITKGNRAPKRDEVVCAVDLSPKWAKVRDPLKDPENVYWQIQHRIDTGKVAGPTAGVRRYIEKVLKDPKAKDETVRDWFKKGRGSVAGENPSTLAILPSKISPARSDS